METAVAQPEGTPLEQQQQETVHDALQTMHGSKTHNLDDTEDYGPLKKKHKYRDDHQRSGSISFSAAHPSAPVGGDIESAANVLDSSARMEHVPFVSPAAAVADAQDGPVAAAAGGDQDHHHLASTDATHAEEQQQTEEAQHQPHHDERSKSRDLASSPGSVNEKARKHNFYVPSREVAFLLDNISSTPASVDFPLQYDPTTTTTTDGIPSATGTGGDNATMNISEAQANANALLAIGTSITGRQAAKIAAMEAKEKSRIAKELELEEAKSKRKAELERKRLENVRKKAEKDASGNGIHNLKRSDSSASNQQADGASPPVSASNATLNSQSKPAANRSKRAAAPRRPNAKTKLDSPELPLPNSATTNASNVAFPPSPDIKIHSPSTSHLAFNPYNNNTASATAPGVMALPPMPEPATEGMMGFIPYASEGARAAALAKAAKQQKMNGGSNAGSPPTSIPVPLPSTKNGKSTSNSGNVGGSSRAGGSSSSSSNNKRGNNNNSKMNKALQNVVSQQSISNSTSSTGRASPTNALEHAAAAIDAVLDAGAAARAQASFEEDEVDDRLYCICQQLYDPERLMIACDRCDNWYHVDCVNIDETSITLIDLFICPICEKDSGLHTVSKSRCAREECNEPALKLSKYCSDLCGIKVAALKLEQSSSSSSSNNHQGSDSDKPENLRLLWDAVSEVKKLETVVRSADSAKLGHLVDGQDIMQNATITGEITEASAAPYNDIPRGLDLDYRIVEEEYRLEQLQNQLSEYVTKRQNLELSLSLINARLSYLRLAIRRWEVTVQAHMANNTKPSGGGSGKSKNKSKSGSSSVNADAPCGFDVRLVWDDKDWQEWLDSDEGRNIMMLAEEGDDAATLLPPLHIPQEEGAEEEDEEGLICTLSRRKCDRHSAWQKLRDADFQVEKAADEKQLEQLTESERRIRRRVEDIQDFLRRANEKLEVERSSKRGLAEQVTNDDNLAVKLEEEEGEEDAEDVEMSESMPLTPALVVQEA